MLLCYAHACSAVVFHVQEHCATGAHQNFHDLTAAGTSCLVPDNHGELPFQVAGEAALAKLVAVHPASGDIVSKLLPHKQLLDVCSRSNGGCTHAQMCSCTSLLMRICNLSDGMHNLECTHTGHTWSPIASSSESIQQQISLSSLLSLPVWSDIF